MDSSVPRGPRFEIGGHFQLHQRDSGVLNGFIEGFESVLVSLTGKKSAKNELRKQEAARPPQGILIAKGGSPIYRDVGTGAGIGDVYVARQGRAYRSRPVFSRCAPFCASRDQPGGQIPFQ